ncbi:hypothetical protein J6590_103697 [Homalodisca vitripennis]|nr:hypothetical protein J6590_103697 [Homalodisca vitripennis]
MEIIQSALFIDAETCRPVQPRQLSLQPVIRVKRRETVITRDCRSGANDLDSPTRTCAGMMPRPLIGIARAAFVTTISRNFQFR